MSAALPLTQGMTLASICGLLGVVAACAFLGRTERPARAGADLAASPSHATEAGGRRPRLEPLVRGIVPVWRQHLGAVQTQTDEAVGSLVGSLGSITDQFEAAGFSLHPRTDGRHASELLAACEHRLQPVIATMREIAASKDALGAHVQQLAATAVDLQGMAEEVARIAQQTNLLAINAAIEAARAGPAGRGFSVIAAEVRRLSSDSAETAHRITQRIDQIGSMMADTSATASRSATADREAIARSGSEIETVLAHVRTLSEDSATMLERGQVIRADIEALMVGLQFQDRISQMIGAVDQDMARLEDSLDADAPAPELPAWLADLQARYTMRDQRHSHQHAASGGTPTTQAPAARKAVFF